MFRTRRELEAQIFTRQAGRRRAAAHRDPNLFEVIVGVTVFLVLAAGCLYAVAILGR